MDDDLDAFMGRNVKAIKEVTHISSIAATRILVSDGVSHMTVGLAGESSDAARCRDGLVAHGQARRGAHTCCFLHNNSPHWCSTHTCPCQMNEHLSLSVILLDFDLAGTCS